MASAILKTISREPPLLRWLHTHDPDRQITVELLRSSATYVTRIPSTESSCQHVTPTLSILVPMYRRKHFILGQLYGPMSPNSIALNMLSHVGYTDPPIPTVRRFVVDLSCQRSMQFIEYEWFSDGNLCVSMHHIAEDGAYEGESILLATPAPAPDVPLTPFIQPNDAVPQSPTHVIMRMSFSERPNCPACTVKRVQCLCPPEMRAPHTGTPLWESTLNSAPSWESWLTQFAANRSGPTMININYTLETPDGPYMGSKTIALEQRCEVGVDINSSTGKLLVTMFIQSAAALLSQPRTDTAAAGSTDAQQGAALANEISEEEEDWLQPKTSLLDEDVLQNCELDAAQFVESGVDDDGIKFARDASLASASIVPASPSVEKGKCESSKTLVQPLKSAIEKGSVYRECGDGSPLRATNRRRKNGQRDKVFVCECGRVFNHRGHYNEHRLCVHERVRQHKCTFANCQSAFFKRSDRDRHMRSKHDFTAVICSKCDATFACKPELEVHMRESHRDGRAHACSACSARYASASGLRLHMQKCQART